MISRRQFFLGSSALAASAMVPPALAPAAAPEIPVTATGMSILMQNAHDAVWEEINRRALELLYAQMHPIIDAWAERLMTSGSLPENRSGFVRIRRPQSHWNTVILNDGWLARAVEPVDIKVTNL